MEIKIHNKFIVSSLLKVFLILFLLNISVIAVRILTGHDVMMGVIPMFDFDRESNIPTLFSTLLLLSSSLLLYFVGKIGKEVRVSPFFWYVLSVVFLFLAVDEFASIHERLTVPVRQVTGVSGALYFAWVIPYALFVLVIGAFSYKFLLGLTSKTRLLFIVAGSVYLSGAIGMEVIGGYISQEYGMDSLYYTMQYTIEESLEMLGIIIFNYSILDYLVGRFGSMVIIVTNSRMTDGVSISVNNSSKS